MPTTPSQRAAMAEKKASSVGAFKKKPAPIELPSGNWVVVKRQGLDSFLAAGKIPNGLMNIIQDKVAGKTDEPVDEPNAQDLFDSPEKLLDLIKSVDLFVCAAMIEPKVYPVPEDEIDRDEDLLYVDELDMEDKMFIFQYAVGGTKDLERFRGGLTGGLAVIPEQPAVVNPTKRPSRAKK